MRILVVEDEAVLRDGLVDLLSGDGHEVEAVGDGAAAVKMGGEQIFDLIVLDWMLPKMDGVEVCQKLRISSPGVLIIMLTARGSEDDKVRGLRVGADDYVTKPFGARELLARIQALGRRVTGNAQETQVIDVNGCTIDLARCQVRRDSTTVSLTPREVGILRWLHQNHERAVSRAELLERVWSAPGNLETRTVDMTIANLRKKVERDPSSPQIVVSVKGVGYAWGERDAP